MKRYLSHQDKSFFSKQFCLSDAEENTSKPLNGGVIADLPLLRTLLVFCQNSQEPNFWDIMDSFVLLAYASLAASRTLLQQLLAYLNFTLDSEHLFCCYKRKNWFLWTAVEAQAAEKHGDEYGLTWYLRSGRYTSFPAWTHSQNPLAAAEALSLTIFSHGPFLKWSRRLSQSARE